MNVSGRCHWKCPPLRSLCGVFELYTRLGAHNSVSLEMLSLAALDNIAAAFVAGVDSDSVSRKRAVQQSSRDGFSNIACLAEVNTFPGALYIVALTIGEGIDDVHGVIITSIKFNGVEIAKA